MTTILYRLVMAYPATIADKANAAAAILDPDTGGAETFTDAYTATVGGTEYVMANIPIWAFDDGEYPELRAIGFSDYGQVMRSKNPAIWFAVLTALAQYRGREFALTSEDVVTLCGAVLFDEEIAE
jgi:hypothetical protein